MTYAIIIETMEAIDKVTKSVLLWTEKKLTHKKALNLYKKQHRTFVGEVLDWLDAILFAVVVVFFINQWFFQLFVIPSPSMEKTLMTGDRVLVSKMTYGVELYPEGPKAFSKRIPDRDDIITFYNPESESRGTLFNILAQTIFRATFTLVNIDKNPDGSMREALLVKRAAGMPGDTVTFVNGEAYIKAAGTGEYVKESDFRTQNGYATGTQRLIDAKTYKLFNAQAILNALSESGISNANLPKHLLNDYYNSEEGYFTDYYGYSLNYNKGLRMIDPMDFEVRSTYNKMKTGLYVPQGYILPLGDNRDNSTDGRYFGPVSADTVNGYVATIIWPASRVGSPY